VTIALRIVVGVVVLSVTVLTASTSWTGVGDTRDERYGRGVGLAGDLNGDGIDEFMVGAVGAANWTGRVQVHDGATKAVVAELVGEGIGYRLGGRLTGAGDFNGDGQPDVVIASVKWGADQRGKVYVLSGPVPSLSTPLFSVTGGAGDSLGDELRGGFDFNRDGFDDILVSSPHNDDGAADGGKIQVLGGPDGRVLFSRAGTDAGRSLGISAGLGDIDADGFLDVIAGSFYSSGAGRVTVYSGLTGGVILTKTGSQSGDRFGVVVSSAGDFNGDGFGDFAVAAPGTGKTYLYAGPNGTLLTVKNDAAEAMAFVSDVNGDGFDDLAVGVPSHREAGKLVGRITVYGGNSLGSGTVLATITGPGSNTNFGYFLAGSAELTAGGWRDLLAGAPELNRKGAAYVLSLP
jgi:hypothetical protein